MEEAAFYLQFFSAKDMADHVLHEYPALTQRQLSQVNKHLVRQMFLLRQRFQPRVMHLRDILTDVVGQVWFSVSRLVPLSALTRMNC